MRHLVAAVLVSLLLAAGVQAQPAAASAASTNDNVCIINGQGLPFIVSDGKAYSFDHFLTRCLFDGGGYGLLCVAIRWNPATWTNWSVSPFTPYTRTGFRCPGAAYPPA